MKMRTDKAPQMACGIIFHMESRFNLSAENEQAA
jgi:hypothetical protein